MGAQPFDPKAKLTFSGGDVGQLRGSPPASTGPQQVELAGGATAPSSTRRASGTCRFRCSAAAPRPSPASMRWRTWICSTSFASPTRRNSPTPTPKSLYQEAIIYVEGRRAMVIVDIPEDVIRIDQMQAWMVDNDSLRHPNSAVYYPRTFTPDPLNQNRLRSLAPSGTIAGLWARTDTARGVWKAPAGTEARLRNVDSLARTHDRPGERAAEPAGYQLPADLPDLQQHLLGRAHAGRRRHPGLRLEIRAGPAHDAVHRGEPLPRHEVGRVRAERRAALGADPAQCRRVHAGPFPQGRLPGDDRRATPFSSSATARRRRRATSTSASSTSRSASHRSSRPSS